MQISFHSFSSYVVSSLAYAIKEGKLPPQFHIVLDDAYVCTNQELTPWKGRNLSSEKDVFNYYLSLQRLVVERVLGLLVQRWGIFWRALRVNMNKIPLVITVACKLHNICVDRLELLMLNHMLGEILEIYRNIDVHGGDDQSMHYTDGTGLRRGHRPRSDLDQCPKREAIKTHLRRHGAIRPDDSTFSRHRGI